jgi:hypothetical protein
MKIGTLFAALIAASFVASPLSAQSASFAESQFKAKALLIDGQCPAGSLSASGKPDNTMIAQDACQKAIDLFKYMAPQLGAVLAGGNPTQGFGGTLGGPGHFSFGIRGNGLQASLPEVDRVVPNTRGAQISTYTIDTRAVGFVTADLAAGLFRGAGSSGFGALDAIVSASYIPTYHGRSVDVSTPSGQIKFGFGAKLGILSESATRPGVSVSFLERDLPQVSITGMSGDDRLRLQDINVRTKSWRVVAGKSFLFMGAGAGFGRDNYNSSASITVKVAARGITEGGYGGPIALGQQLSRNNLFGTVWIKSRVMRIVGELGVVSGGNIVTYNDFTGVQAADKRTYASAGLSFGR